MDGASKQLLQNEFGTDKEEDAIIKILESGTLQNVEVCCLALALETNTNVLQNPARDGDRNDSKGAFQRMK